ncbi:uncharacterized protein BX663DRAFT_471185 [Cokeromyces recurvatus]|uniref:uncharacterized protein n=1 Tax=Cokeromyces recurvatus TaxID=90255 RepID=UPI0022201577|nr:uncharacterized protein BX663DRAFT_471185 [Cokeromyces recurvatus]KAI7904075.1 hypothetical protein BX663DRAFT_471185 [Cokeromyces recurvatus]
MPFFPDNSFREFVQQYKEHIKEKEESNKDNWEFYVKNKDFTVYRRPAHDRNPNLFEYRSFGGWDDVEADILAHVYLDLEFRKKWDKNMQSHQYFQVTTSTKENDYNGNHFEMKYPWPLANRDYVYTIERKIVKDKNEGKEYQVILGESLPSNYFPERKGVIRIDTYMQNICITSTENGKGCIVFMDYFDDPKGNIPKSLINWAAKTGVPTFINNLKAACQEYKKEHPDGTPPLDKPNIIEL